MANREQLGRALMIPLALLMSADDVRSMLEDVQRNGQIWGASGTSAILEVVFDTTRNLLTASHSHWPAFVDARIADSRDATDHYAYPTLQQRLAVNGN